MHTKLSCSVSIINPSFVAFSDVNLVVEDACFKAVYIVSDVEVGVVERLGVSLVRADSLVIA